MALRTEAPPTSNAATENNANLAVGAVDIEGAHVLDVGNLPPGGQDCGE